MPRIDRRLFAHFDWALLVFALLVIGAGLLTVTSASGVPDRLFSRVALRQCIWGGAGLMAMTAMLSFDYHRLERYGYWFYALTLVLLVATALFGSSGGGARRWLGFGPFAIQPSEFAKIGLVIGLSRFLHRDVGERPLSLGSTLIAAALWLPPAVLILKQPDLGTVIALSLAAGSVVLMAGLRLRLVLCVVAVLAPAGPYAWSHLKPYQQQRIWTFMDPAADPLGSGYHIIQSKIAIGSGMLHGKGFLHGTQNRLNFLPEQHTDFIFSVFAEEWGFLGTCGLLFLYSGLMLRCFLVASRARDSFGALLAFGLSAMIFWQVVVNIGMATGSLPVVGITLPFFSYGGSSLLACMVAIGLLLNISMRRFTF